MSHTLRYSGRTERPDYCPSWLFIISSPWLWALPEDMPAETGRHRRRARCCTYATGRISLRRISLSNGSRHTADVRRRTVPTPGLLGITHLRQQKEVSHPAARAAPSTKFAITMRHRGKQQTSDIELPSRAIEVLALEAMSRDLDIAKLIGQVLVAAINKDMIKKILR